MTARLIESCSTLIFTARKPVRPIVRASACEMNLKSFFRGTRPRFGKVIEAIGAEVVEIVNGKITAAQTLIRPSKLLP